jgi:hypothetical protein
VAISDLETLVRKCSGKIECGFARFDLSIGICTRGDPGGQYKDR